MTDKTIDFTRMSIRFTQDTWDISQLVESCWSLMKGIRLCCFLEPLRNVSFIYENILTCLICKLFDWTNTSLPLQCILLTWILFLWNIHYVPFTCHRSCRYENCQYIYVKLHKCRVLTVLNPCISIYNGDCFDAAIFKEPATSFILNVVLWLEKY